MFKNYFIVSLRNLFRQKTYTLINIFGLSFAISVNILIFLFVENEWSHDRFHEHRDNIFRVYQKIQSPSGERVTSTTALPLAPDLKARFAEIEESLRITSSSLVVRRGDNAYTETVVFTDAAFFDVFSFPILRGDSVAPLDQPHGLVITHEMAARYFDDIDPIGSVLTLGLEDGPQDFVVSAVADDQRQHSSLSFDFVANIAVTRSANPGNFIDYDIAFAETYLKLSPHANPLELQGKFPGFIQDVIGGDDDPGETELHLQPLTEVFLSQEVPSTIAKAGKPIYSLILCGLGLLVLLIACINFVILSVGRSAGRAKEVGMRKVMGAFRSQLTSQYVGEAVLVSFISLLAGNVLATVLLPTFNAIAGKTLTFSLDSTFLLFLFILTGITGLIAGSYPAVVLSRFQPAVVLKGTPATRGRGALSRVLVVLQFSLSILLIIGTLVIRQQVQFMRDKNLGMDQSRVLEVSLNNPPNAEAAERVFQRYRTELLGDNNIHHVSAAMNEFGTPWTRLGFEQTNGSSEDLYFNQVALDFIQTMGMSIVAGRDFSEAFPSDVQQGILVNEALVRHFGWEDPVGASIPGSRLTDSHEIIGVVKDFHFSSLHNPIEPLVMALDINTISSGITGLHTWNWPPRFNRVLVRIGPGPLGPIVDFMQERFAAVAPQEPFALRFLDEVLNAQYAQEVKWREIIDLVSILAIAIACLGLFGLTASSVERRVKEIGIRKTIGASAPSIVSLLSRDMLLLVAAANLIAWPLAYVFLANWLQNFAYRIDLAPGAFLLASFAVLVIAFLTIATQAVRAANANPVVSLRAE